MLNLACPAAPTVTVGAAPVGRHQLARQQAALFDAREALHALRNEYPRQPARFARIRAAIVCHRQARTIYKAAAEAFHASSEGEQLQRLRQRYAHW